MEYLIILRCHEMQAVSSLNISKNHFFFLKFVIVLSSLGFGLFLPRQLDPQMLFHQIIFSNIITGNFALVIQKFSFCSHRKRSLILS